MPIAMTKEEWARITRWADSSKEDPEVVRRREHVRFMNETSQQMTSNWPNSLENVNKRSEELRRARVAAAEEANTKFYQRYVKRKREEQQRLMYDARDTVFKNKDAPKLLLGAVIETVIQKERQEQVKFNQELKSQADEQKRKYDEEIIQQAKEWHALMALRRQRRFDVNKQHQKEILDQAHEVSERNRIEYETELNLQKIDNIKADEQMDAIRNFEDDFREKEKARILSDMQRSKQEAANRRREQAARDAMDARLMEVLERSRARTEARKKLTEKQIKEEKQAVLEKISQKLESGDAARDAKEQQILDKAIKEKEAIAEAKRQAQKRKEDQFKQERIDIRKQFLEKEEQRLHEFNTMRQWEIMNRFKNAEIYEAFQEKLREEKKQKIKQYREDIIYLWRERDEREAKQRAETRHFYGELAEQKLRDADNKLLTHATALLQEAAQHGRPDYALRHAVDRYCKLYRLYPMPELPTSLQEHHGPYAPRDQSQPDPGYRYPEPPIFLDDGVDNGAKRDGLQDSKVKPGPSKSPAPSNKESEDYKRAAPANGLQRKHAQPDLRLPPLVRPCETPQCNCELKKDK